MQSLFKRLWRDDRGTSAVEYGLILAMVCLASLAALKGLGNENTSIYSSFAAKVTKAIDESSAS